MKKRKTTLIIIIIIILMGMVTAGAAAVIVNYDRWFSGGSTPAVASSSEESRPPIDPSASEYSPPEPQSSDAGGIAIPGWDSMTIPAGETEVTVDFSNPEANAGKYYLTFELRLKDTGEVLYTSGLVNPGLHIQHITLSRALDAGRYPAVIHVQPYKMDESLSLTNNADMELELIVVG